MSPLEQLKSLLNQTYRSEDGDEYRAEPKPGLTDEQIRQLAAKLPTQQIPPDIRELLLTASGFEYYSPEEITFAGVGMFGFENVFPYSVELAGDGFGNFWILDVTEDGNWDGVFYVCHDPAVVIRQSQDLAEFISHIDEFGKNRKDSILEFIHEKGVFDIWEDEAGFITAAEARNSLDQTMSAFGADLPEQFVIFDLRNKPNGSGFPWGKFGPNIENAVRCKTELLWGFDTHAKKPNGRTAERQPQKGFLAKLFRR